MESRIRSASLHALFLLSGVSALGCQLIWTRMFALGLGHELPAMLAVVAAFFAGFALGAWALDRAVSRAARPGRWYGTLELIIGLWTAASALLIPRGNALALSLIGLNPSPLRHWTVAFLIPLVALAPATIAMGSTLAAIDRFAVHFSRSGRCVGSLYAINTLGAAAGVLLSTFWLMPTYGFRASLLFFAANSVACGMAALIMDQMFHRGPVPTHGPPSRPGRTALAESSPAPVHRLIGLAVLTGLLGIGYEVLAVRALSQVLENTIYSYGAALAVYLFGTALGAAVVNRLAARVSPDQLITGLLAALGLACSIGMGVISQSPPLYALLRDALGDSLTGVVASEGVVALSVFTLPTLLMGALFSLLCQSARSDRGGVGSILGWNTLGGAFAPPIFGVLGLPALGCKWALVIVSLGYWLLSFASTNGRPLARGSGGQGISGQLLWRVIGLVVTAGLPLALPADLHLVALAPGTRLIEYREGVSDSVAVVGTPDAQRSLRINNRFTMGGTASANAERRHAQIPLLLHPAPRRALFLGAGTGITFGASTAHRDLTAQGVELVPEVAEVLSQFEPANAHAQWAPRLTLFVADARRFIKTTPETYDVIVADLFHPARDGAGTLYTLEHFRAIRERFALGGLFCQWLPLYQMDEPTLKIITATFLQVFPEAHGFLLRLNLDTPVLGLVGFTAPMQYGADWVERRLTDQTLREALQPIGLTETLQLLGEHLAGPSVLASFSAHARINTDDQPLVMFQAPRFTFRRQENSYGRLFTLLAAGRDQPADLLGIPAMDPAFATRLSRYVQARDIYLEGLKAEQDGHREQAEASFLQSARASPDFSTGYAYCLTLAAQRSQSNPSSARRLLEQLIEAQPDRPVAKQLLERLFK